MTWAVKFPAYQSVANSAPTKTIAANGRSRAELRNVRKTNLRNWRSLIGGTYLTCQRPEPIDRGIMKLRPFSEHSLRTLAKAPQLYFKMLVIVWCRLVGVAELCASAFQRLNANVQTAHYSSVHFHSVQGPLQKPHHRNTQNVTVGQGALPPRSIFPKAKTRRACRDGLEAAPSACEPRPEDAGDIALYESLLRLLALDGASCQAADDLALEDHHQ